MWTTVAGYVTLGVVSVALYFYYNPDAYKKWLQEVSTPLPEQTRPQQKKSKQKRISKLEGNDNASSTATSASEAPASKKRKIVSAPVNETVTAKTVEGGKTTLPRLEDDGMSNAAFAQQLKQAQTGTKLEKQTQQGPSKKERRAAKAASGAPQGFDSPSLSAETSSTGGRDADDDMSPNDTPPSSVARADDVSDMLEPTPAKPQTLRLTSTDAPQQKKPAPKQFEQVLTKKQRQRRQKQEENRLMREESDRQHEAKKQQQMRAARTAEGSSKQTKATNFTQNAWQSKPVEKQEPTAQPTGGPLLDTFESENKESVSTKPMSDIANQAEASVPDAKENIGEKRTEALAASERERPNLSQKTSWADQMDAHEQDQWAEKLLEQDQWNEVSSKKTKKKTRKDTQDTSSEASQPLSKVASVTKPTNSNINGTQTNGTTKAPSQNRFEAVGGDDVWEA